MSRLRKAALSGVRWIVLGRVGLQLVTWPITIVVMRLLEPHDYGVFAIALMIQGFIATFAELGFGVALVQAPEVTETQRRMAATLLLLLNTAIAGVIALVAPWVARAYDDPGVTTIMWALSAELCVAAVGAVPTAMLERELRFRALSIVQIAAGVSGSLVTLTTALAGAGVWALVAGTRTLALVRTVGTLIAYGGVVWPGRVVPDAVRPMVTVGGHTLAMRALWYWFGQADNLFLGLLLHVSQLGAYNTASQLAMLPAGKAMEAVNRVAFPVLCQLRDQVAEMRATAGRVRGLLALYGFGVCWGLAAVAPEFVLLVLGDKWYAARWPLTILSLVAPLRMLSAFHNTVVTAAGRPQAATRELILAAALVPAAVAFGAWIGGLVSASLAWLLAYPVVFAASIVFTSGVLKQQPRQAVAPLVAPLLAGAAMLGSVWLCRDLLSASVSLPVLLSAEVVIGGAIYTGALWMGARGLLAEVRNLALDILRPERVS